MPRKGYVKHKPKNLVRLSGTALHFVSINRNGHQSVGETPSSREFGMLIQTISSLKYHYLAVDLDVLKKEGLL